MKNLPSVRVSDPDLAELQKLKLRQKIVAQEIAPLPTLFDVNSLPDSVGQKNCENWLGSVSLPVGVAGPVNLTYQGKKSTHYVPIATTEGALVASISRGAKAMAEAGGSLVQVKKIGMSRAPVFLCQSGEAALELQQFVDQHQVEIKQQAESTSNHLTFSGHQSWVRGRHLYLRFVFDTSEAMGMNMVTIATQKISDWLEAQQPQIKLVALSSNVCSDKKDNFINSVLGRGYWAQAEVTLSAEILSQVLKTSAQQLFETHLQKNLIGSNLAGSFSQNAQVANVLAGIFLATGQDPAHIVEGSRAFLTIDLDGEGIYAALTLPNLNMGTVGGGTYLPAQSEARALMGIGAKETNKLVAITAASCLAGELSLLASLGEKSLARAHQTLAR